MCKIFKNILGNKDNAEFNSILEKNTTKAEKQLERSWKYYLKKKLVIVKL